MCSSGTQIRHFACSPIVLASLWPGATGFVAADGPRRLGSVKRAQKVDSGRARYRRSWLQGRTLDGFRAAGAAVGVESRATVLCSVVPYRPHCRRRPIAVIAGVARAATRRSAEKSARPRPTRTQVAFRGVILRWHPTGRTARGPPWVREANQRHHLDPRRKVVASSAVQPEPLRDHLVQIALVCGGRPGVRTGAAWFAAKRADDLAKLSSVAGRGP
jgi:hypothetical protein